MDSIPQGVLSSSHNYVVDTLLRCVLIVQRIRNRLTLVCVSRPTWPAWIKNNLSGGADNLWRCQQPQWRCQQPQWRCQYFEVSTSVKASIFGVNNLCGGVKNLCGGANNLGGGVNNLKLTAALLSLEAHELTCYIQMIKIWCIKMSKYTVQDLDIKDNWLL